MSDQFLRYIGNWVKLTCTNFTCTGKIESITENKIILSNFISNDIKVSTRFIGIDVQLITVLDFIQQQNLNKNPESINSIPVKPALLNVYTSESQPPQIRRGGSSSAVSRNLLRQNSSSQEKFIKSKNSSFSDFGYESRRNSISNSSHEPAWLNFSPEDISTDFDFDKNLALFDKQSLKNIKKSFNESSDSSESNGIQVNYNFNKRHSNIRTRKPRSKTISFDPDDFSMYNENNGSKFLSNSQKYLHSHKTGSKRDILTEFKHIGIIPMTADTSQTAQIHKSDQKTDVPFQNLTGKLFQQPDLVREITQKHLKNGYSEEPYRHSVISINSNTDNFSGFSEYWNLEDNFTFPVFTTKQRDLLFETACQLGIDIQKIHKAVGVTLSEFVITQVGGSIRFNEANVNLVPKIAILLGSCDASMYAISVGKYLLQKGCNLLVFRDENKTSNINYKIEHELKMFEKLLSVKNTVSGYNLVTYDMKDLSNKTFDFIISGVECDASRNSPSVYLKKWLLNQKAHILCINPPKRSSLAWRSGVFIGVPTFSYSILNDNQSNHLNESGVPVIDSSRKIDLKKPEGVILLCNVNLPDRVFSFLKLNYRSPFVAKNWVRLYREDDLCLVE